MMIAIAYQLIAPETLDHLLAEIVLREGTGYGEIEISFAEKKHQRYQQFMAGKATIIYLGKEDFFDVMRV